MREKLTLPADRKVLAQIANLIGRYAKYVNFNSVEQYDIQVAVAEACTNVIVHGLGENANREFEFFIEATTDNLKVTLRENGAPFDPEKETEPDLTSSLHQRKIGGLGLHLIRELMDSVEYSTDSDGVKTFTMTKNKSVTS